jgi:hypothetical protein
VRESPPVWHLCCLVNLKIFQWTFFFTVNAKNHASGVYFVFLLEPYIRTFNKFYMWGTPPPRILVYVRITEYEPGVRTRVSSGRARIALEAGSTPERARDRLKTNFVFDLLIGVS